MTTLRVLNKRVVVKRLRQVERTKSGLYLPASARELPGLATVVAVGVDSDLQIGDLVMLPKYDDNQRIWLNGEEVEVLREQKCLAAITKEEDENGTSS